MSSPILIGENTLTEFQTWLAQRSYSQILVLTDENTSEHCYPRLKNLLPFHRHHRIPAGETHKNLRTCEWLWQVLTTYRFDRRSLVINLGGGVLGDMGGFVAATYKRGLDFIQIPTTLLSMVDASVGGKLGIDFRGFKNHIGLFQEPQAVFIWPPFLETLPPDELRSGFAEVIKHSLIADSQAWEKLKHIGSLGELDWETIIRHSVEIKAEIVDRDLREEGERMALNFGHTLGHALESYFLDTPERLLHGEAVALGMVAESWLSMQRGYLSPQSFEDVSALISRLYPPRKISAGLADTLWKRALQDKKNLKGQVRCTLIEGPGQYHVKEVISRKEFGEAIAALARFSHPG